MLHFHAQFGITNMVLISSNFFFHIQPFTNINKYIKPTDSPRTPITHTHPVIGGGESGASPTRSPRIFKH